MSGRPTVGQYARIENTARAAFCPAESDNGEACLGSAAPKQARVWGGGDGELLLVVSHNPTTNRYVPTQAYFTTQTHASQTPTMAWTTSATVSPVQQEQFDDALHHLVNATRRPKTEEQQQELRDTLSRLLSIAGSSNSNNYVKTLVLALTHKRYHGLAPTAKLLSTTESATGGKSTGEGERLVYYTAFRYLLEQLITAAAANADESTAQRQ